MKNEERRVAGVWRVLVVGACVVGGGGLACAQAISPEALVAAYPEQLRGLDGDSLVWREGTKQPLSNGSRDKSFDEKLRNASLLDQLSLPYPKGPLSQPPGPQDDPGRFRNAAFFDKMYGDCDRGETQKRLVTIAWVGGQKLKATSVNGVAEKLRSVARELETLPADLKRFAVPSAGTFSCRVVKDTGKRSMHAYGAAIDVNVKYSDYWLWSKGAYRNRIPYKIVEIFERHGFIWGGKWGHYDTMHFEYRPEFFVGAPHKENSDKAPH
ncbi:MAG: M15 family metallopeptidase [Methylocystis sp.]|uniref:M15 family metallopeptidase n=1 Tax=Methylocystis sp. TaxID=1911079 RepID=UPI003D0F6C04